MADTNWSQWDSRAACTDCWWTWSNVSTSKDCRGVTNRALRWSRSVASDGTAASILDTSWFVTSEILSGKYGWGASRCSSTDLLITVKDLISWDAMWQADAFYIMPLPQSVTAWEVQPILLGTPYRRLTLFREEIYPLRLVMLKCWGLLMEQQVLPTQVEAIRVLEEETRFAS